MKKVVILSLVLILSSLLMFVSACTSQNSPAVSQDLYNQLRDQNDSLQKQLTQSQQNVTQLQAQLTQAQQKVTDLQTNLNKTTVLPPSPPPELFKGPEVNLEGNVWGGGYASVPIELNKDEKIQGQITKPLMTGLIQDPDGTTVKDLGSAEVTQFSLTAKTTGRYLIVMRNTNSNTGTAYKLQYWIYSYK